jgi:hypothetical protein
MGDVKSGMPLFFLVSVFDPLFSVVEAPAKRFSWLFEVTELCLDLGIVLMWCVAAADDLPAMWRLLDEELLEMSPPPTLVPVAEPLFCRRRLFFASRELSSTSA